MSSKIYKVTFLGPPYTGKTQLCYFIEQGLSNFKREKLYSEPQGPNSYNIKRCDINLELIDSPLSCDCEDNNESNLEKMANYQREKKEIDHILLILKFGVRLTNNGKNYFKLLAKIFTSAEFFNHLIITLVAWTVLFGFKIIFLIKKNKNIYIYLYLSIALYHSN